MKLKAEPIEVDVYVNPKPLTKKERQELVDFIKAYKEKQKLKKSRQKKAA